MRETRSSGSVRGASGDGRPYREATREGLVDRAERPLSLGERTFAGLHTTGKMRRNPT